MPRIPHLAFLLLAVTTPVAADPVPDKAMLQHAGGWYSNNVRGQFLDCPATCTAQTNTQAEGELSAAPRTENVYVCKSAYTRRYFAEANKTPGWLYGNQFDERVQCYSVDTKGTVRRDKRFRCLCVSPRSADQGDEKGGVGACSGADLVIASIAPPTWDAGNSRTVIQATIKNIGDAPASPSQVRVVDPTTNQRSGAPYNDVTDTPTLAAGASTVVRFHLPYWIYNPDVTLEFAADYKHAVGECNENNNAKTFEGVG